MNDQRPTSMTADEFWARVDKVGDCWIWKGAFKGNGYGQVGRNQFAHRFAYELENGPIPEGMNVMHSCDNPPCVRPDHLSLGSHSENMVDSYRKGRLPLPGPASKLTDEIVLTMRAEYAETPRTFKSIAATYGVDLGTAWDAIRGKTFSYLPGAVPVSTCDAQTGYEATEWGFRNLWCSTAIGLRRFVDRLGTVRKYCAAPGHREAVMGRYGVRADISDEEFIAFLNGHEQADGLTAAKARDDMAEGVAHFDWHGHDIEVEVV